MIKKRSSIVSTKSDREKNKKANTYYLKNPKIGSEYINLNCFSATS